MRMMYMQNMRRYLVRSKGLCPESLSEDSTDEPAVDWAGLCGELKGPMALLISSIKAF